MDTLTTRLDTQAARMAEKVDGLGREAAENLHAAASSVRRGGHQGAQAMEGYAGEAATTLDDAGEYVEKHTVKRSMAESRQFLRRYPVETLALSTGVGLLAGIAMHRMLHSCAATARKNAF